MEIQATICGGRVISAATIVEPITDGFMEISGFHNMAEAQHLADQINHAGAPAASPQMLY